MCRYYFLLSNGTLDLGGQEGQAVFDALVAAGKRGVRIRIVQNLPDETFPDVDSKYLAENGLAEVRSCL